jgi:hypothetical protein
MCNKETVHTVWHTLEYFGNTLIFLLAGCIIGSTVFTRSHGFCLADCGGGSTDGTGAGVDVFAMADVGYVVLVYALSLLIRALMLLCFSPVLSRLGDGVEAKELVVMAWGGLRGAVGLALAIVVDHDSAVSYTDGSKIILLVGGMATLTLVVNGTTCGWLLRRLGMTDTPKAAQMLGHAMDRQVVDFTRGTYEALALDRERYCMHERAQLEGYCSALRRGGGGGYSPERARGEGEAAAEGAAEGGAGGCGGDGSSLSVDPGVSVGPGASADLVDLVRRCSQAPLPLPPLPPSEDGDSDSAAGRSRSPLALGVGGGGGRSLLRVPLRRLGTAKGRAAADSAKQPPITVNPERATPDPELLAMARSLFLNCLRASYWKQVRGSLTTL